jgi:hypothetical protein
MGGPSRVHTGLGSGTVLQCLYQREDPQLPRLARLIESDEHT